MTDNAGQIIDALGTDFPPHLAKVSALDQILSDVLGTVFHNNEFVDCFFEINDDAILMEVSFVCQPLVLTIPGFSSFVVSLGQADELELEVAVVLDQTGARFLLFDAPIFLQCSSTDLLTPVTKTNDKWEPDVDSNGAVKKLSLVLSGVSFEINSAGAVDITTNLKLDLPPVRIGKSGVVVEMKGLRLCMSDQVPLPASVPAGSRGFAIDSIDVYLPESIKGTFAPNEIIAEGLFIGSGGFTGKLSAEWTAGKPLQLAGIECTLKSLLFEFKQNSLVASELICELKLPFFERPINLDVSFSGDGSLLASLSAVQPAGVDYDGGLIHFEKENVFKATIDGISFELKNGVSTLSISGAIQPAFLSQAGQSTTEAPTFRIKDLSIDSHGHVNFAGGWMDLPEQHSLDFHGFKVGITKLGFGKTDDGGKWIGFSGNLKLVDGFTAGASVEGLRLTWYEDGRAPKVSFNGIGVEFEIPDVLKFKGFVSYRELEVNGSTVRRFDGDIKLSLISLKLDIDAKLVIGRSSGGADGDYNFFAIYLGVEFPTGIPISPTPISLYGIAGLFALQMEPDKHADEEWYEGWFKRTEVGTTDLKSKWINHRGSLAFGVGATIGTGSDNGFTFACKALLIIVFPGPIFLLEGKANLLKERAKLDADPMFRTLAVLDMRQKQILMGLDAKYKQDEQGKVIDIRAGAEAFFAASNNWHIYMGEKEPRDKRIRARILNLFDANSYFMIDPKRLATGAWVGYARQWNFGPVTLTLEAWLEGNVVVNWTPLHFHGDLWLHGNIEVHVFGFGLGLSVDARFAADVFDPFHVIASFEVSVKLPKPLKKKHFEITLEWGPIPKWPERLPLPLKEIAVEHFKVTTTWPLPKNGDHPLLLPKYDPDKEGLRDYYPPAAFNTPAIEDMPIVPLDCRPHISFGRSVHDDALIGVNPQPVQPDYECIGDPERNEGPVRVRYGLKEIELAKWNRHENVWEVAAHAPQVTGVPALYGSWAALPQLPSGAGQATPANTKLWLWSKTPFDYTRHGGGDLDDWLISHPDFSTYPCVPQEVPDREVCVDFEKLDSSQILQSPWQVPEHPEITIGWQAPPCQHVATLEQPVNGFTHALSFPSLVSTCLPPPPADLNPPVWSHAVLSGNDTQPNTVTIKLSIAAKRVTVWLVEPKSERLCLNFRERRESKIQLPHLEQGVTFAATGETSIASVKTTIGDMMGWLCPADFTIELPCVATTVELMLTYQPFEPGTSPKPPKVEARDSSSTKLSEKSLINPAGQPEIVRFEINDLKKIKITCDGARVYLHELCFLCTENPSIVTATAFNQDEKQAGVFANRGDVVEIVGKDLARIYLNSNSDIRLLKICVLFGPHPKEITRRQEMQSHLESEVARWSQTGEVLEPFAAYRLKVVTTIDAHGEGKLSGSQNLVQTEYAYFQTEGPPGLTKLSLPAGRNPADADKFDSGLEDLTRYVNQTTPPTVPAVGQKPVMAKPFYRAYDVGVHFNENYVDLMYRISGRDLGLYLYDNNNLPVTDAEGRLFVQSGDWGAVEELTLTEGEQKWVALSNTANRCLPVIEQESIVHDKKLTSAIAGRVLRPDTVYEARLIPLLLHENFRSFAPTSIAKGPSGSFGRWLVHDEGNSDGPSTWELHDVGSPPVRYLVQTSNIKGGTDSFKPGTMLVLGNVNTLDTSHTEQPSSWTDYRFSVFLSASSGGAMGLVFRYGDINNYYRFSMDRNGQYRRLVSVVNGSRTILKQDNFAYEMQFDYLVTVEAIGTSLRVYQDGELIFDITDVAHGKGSVGLYCCDNPNTRFNDVRVDDFRQTAPVVYRFEFTTSLFANFFHHLHSYQDETWRAVVDETVAAAIVPALQKAVSPSTSPSDEEARAYEKLAAAALGPTARQNSPEVQVSRIEIDGESLAFLVQSPEPFDWSRTEISFWRTGLARTEPALPANVKLAAVNFAPNRVDIESVVLLLRELVNLSEYKIESRLVMWPVQLESGVVLDAQALSGEELPQQQWTPYHQFETGKPMPAGTTLNVSPTATANTSQLVGLDATSVDFSRRIFYSVEVRVVSAGGKILHARHFVPDENYLPEDVNVLRKADGTGFFIVKPDKGLNSVGFSLAQYRLKFIYHRNNTARVQSSLIWGQAGDESDEAVVLDIPVQTQ